MSDVLEIIDELEQALIRNDLALAERLSRSLVADAETDPIVAACMQKVFVSATALRSFEQARALVATEQYGEALRLVRSRLQNFQKDNAYDQELPAVRALDALEVLLDEREGHLRLTTVDDTLDVAQHAKVMSELLERAANDVMDAESTKQNLPLVPDLDKETARRPTARRDSGEVPSPAKRRQAGPMRSTEDAIRSAVSAIGGGSSRNDVGTPMLLASIAKSLFRVKPIAIGFIVLMAALVLGTMTRSVKFRSELSMVRAEDRGERLTADAGGQLIRLPKESLRRLPHQPEVLEAFKQKLEASFPNVLFDIGALDKGISSTVDTGEYGQTDVALFISFTHPVEAIAKRGGEILQDVVNERHAEVVSTRITKSFNSYIRDVNIYKDEVADLREEIYGFDDGAGNEMDASGPDGLENPSLEELETRIFSGKKGDPDRLVNLVDRWIDIARTQLDDAVAEKKAVIAKAASLANDITTLDDTTTTQSESSSESARDLIQNSLMGNIELLRRQEGEIKKQIESVGAGEGHPLIDALKEKQEEIGRAFQNMKEVLAELEAKTRMTESTGPNRIKDEARLQKIITDALIQGAQEREREARVNLQKALAALFVLMERQAKMIDTKRVFQIKQEMLSNAEQHLEDLRRHTEIGHAYLIPLTASATPIKEQGSMGAIMLLALTAGLIAAALVSLLDTYEIDVSKESKQMLDRGRTVVLEFIKRT